jgi:hypothetical protein
MKFACDIGGPRKRNLKFSRNWFTGGVTITVDGRTVYRATMFAPGIHFSLSLVRRYAFTLRDSEYLEIVIEKHRPHLGDFGLPNEYRVTENGRITAVFYGWRKAALRNENGG